jgi:hypothetical protein
MAALERDAALIDYGVKLNVLIASPLTLIALLRAASFGWNQQRLTINARRSAAWAGACTRASRPWPSHFRGPAQAHGGTFSDLQQGDSVV